VIPESVIFWIGAGVSVTALLGVSFAIETQAQRDARRQRLRKRAAPRPPA